MRTVARIVGFLMLIPMFLSAATLVRSARTLLERGGRPALRDAVTLMACAVLLSVCAYAAWFVWPLLSGTYALPRDPEAARSLGSLLIAPGKSLLVVVAHPDDAEWYAGGTLALASSLGADVHVLVATNGERGRGNADAEALALQRKREQEEAGRVLGYSRLVFLELPDRGLRRSSRLADLIRSEMVSVMPDLVLTFDAERPARPYVHPDHQAVGWAVLELLEGELGDGATAALFSSASPDAAVDITAVVEKKAAAVSSHRSQMADRGGWGAVRQNREIGKFVGYEYAELFRVSRTSSIRRTSR
ncbi:MAG: PIG-L family deacetylase [Firmicutes bacterium]|nr:PIG-L family deacetylase [Bacillota bacterium]